MRRHAVQFVLDERAAHQFMDPVPARAYHDLLHARGARLEVEARARDAAAAYARAHPVALATLALPVGPVAPDGRWPAFAAELLPAEPGVRDEPVVLLPPSATTEHLAVVLDVLRRRHAGLGPSIRIPARAPSASPGEPRLTVDDAALDALLEAVRAAPVRELAGSAPGAPCWCACRQPPDGRREARRPVARRTTPLHSAEARSGAVRGSARSRVRALSTVDVCASAERRPDDVAE
jgi:hypothetical protein